VTTERQTRHVRTVFADGARASSTSRNPMDAEPGLDDYITNLTSPSPGSFLDPWRGHINIATFHVGATRAATRWR
jgi:hypothetical protein